MTVLSLEELNGATAQAFSAALEGIYEHSPWIAQRAAAWRPFASLAALRIALVRAVREAHRDEALALLRAHPELAGKAMVARALTAESTDEQTRSGLTRCTPEEFERLQQLNADYSAKFGFPFILAVRGPRGLGLTRHEIIETFARRLQDTPEREFRECLRNVHRIAEIRLNERFGVQPLDGEQVLDWAGALARHSDPGFAEAGQLTVTYLTPAHQSCARALVQQMHDCGFDEVWVDAVGNVNARYRGTDPGAPSLLTGSHFDTVRNAGRYDGRLGILVALASVRRLARAGRRLPFGIELVAFAEEEGQRYRTAFLGSSVLVGAFDATWLDQVDAQGILLRQAMHEAGCNPTPSALSSARRDPRDYLGFVEVHIEQGPVLTERDLPLGVVTAINGSVRYTAEAIGQAAHAGTTPMGQRRDAALAVAEVALHLEQCARSAPDVVATVGLLEVPGGSVNVIPGRCRFSLDIRATTDAARDACEQQILAFLAEVEARRGVRFQLQENMRVAAAPCAEVWRRRWSGAVAALGLPVLEMPSGAGHDAMMMHRIMPQGMLFVRGLNGGISHNPLEAVTADDAELAVRAFDQLLEHLARGTT